MSLDNKLVKDPHSKISFTPVQISELKKCMHPVTGPEYFITNYLWVQHPTKGRMLIKLFDYQKELLEVYHSNRKSVSLLARQTGKCLEYNSYITVRNKQGDTYELPIGKFHDYSSGKLSINDLIEYKR